MLGRVMAVDNALAFLCNVFSGVAGGLLLDKAGLSPYYVSFIMAIVAFVTMIMWTVYRSSHIICSHIKPALALNPDLLTH